MTNQIVMLDYGFGNIRSAQKAFQKIGAQTEISNDYQKCLNADGLVIPGVGAFKACMQGILKAKANELVDKRLSGGRNVLGICVGMQIMFDKGTEHGETTAGLGQWPGVVDEINNPVLPHMGWNEVKVEKGSLIFQGVEEQKFYFVHSYAAKDLIMKDSEKFDKPLKHFTTYGEKFLASVENNALVATQFHPEKSGDAGISLLKNWLGSF